jgi:DNA primase
MRSPRCAGSCSVRATVSGPTLDQGRRGFAEAPVAPLAATRALAGQLSGERLRLALILATLCRYPTLIDTFEERIERLEPADPDIAALALFLLGTSQRDRAALRDEIAKNGHLSTLETLEATGHLRITPFLSDMPTISTRPGPALRTSFRNRPRHRHGRAN